MLKSRHLAQRLTKLMDQHAAAPTYETHLFQRLSGVECARAQNLLAAQLKARRHFYIQGGRAATEMSSPGRSIIIKGQERRRRRGKKCCRRGCNKIGPRVIHLRPWRLLSLPPTHLTLPDSWCSSSTSAPLFSPPLRSPIAIFPRCV